MEKAQRRILLIDKEPWWADSFFKPVLDQRGYKVEVEPDESKALSRMGRRHYALIVLNSPTGEYADVLQAIHTHYPDIRVIVVSAAPSWRGARESFRLGAVDYLSKSYDEDKLVQSVEAALANPPSEC